MTQWRGDDPASHVTLLVLLPFAAYLLAEHLGVSGILAAVAAGWKLGGGRSPPYLLVKFGNWTRPGLGGL